MQAASAGGRLACRSLAESSAGAPSFISAPWSALQIREGFLHCLVGGAWRGRETSETEVRKMLVHGRERFAQLGFEDTVTFSQTGTFKVTFWSVPLKEATVPICLALHRRAHNLSHLPSTSGT